MTDPKAPGERLARMLADLKSMLAFPDDAVIPDHCTPEMIADPSLGACKRMREGCIELGPWLPFYQGYVCGACLRADQADVDEHRWPFREAAGTEAEARSWPRYGLPDC